MTMTARAYKLQIARPASFQSRMDWSAGQTVRTPLPARVDIVEVTGDTPDVARRMAAAQYGVALESVGLVLDDDGRPMYREYDETPSRGTLRGRARSGEDGFGR